MKQTIAWIGEIDRSPEAFRRLTERYRLIWVVQDKIPADPSTIENPLPEVEVVSCAKEGCWEADIIVLAGEGFEDDLFGKIREVATQKIVMVITYDERKQEKLAQIQEALPFSKTVEVILHPDEMILSGENPEAVDTARRIVQQLGY